MFVSFMQPFNNDLGIINFTPFDDEPTFFNHVSGSHLLPSPPLQPSPIAIGVETTIQQQQQSFIHSSYLPSLQPTLPHFASSFESKSTSISTSSSQENKYTSFSNSYLYDTKPRLRNPSNTLLLSSFSPKFERYNNNNKNTTIANHNYTNNNNYFSTQPKPTPLWPFMNKGKKK